MIPILYTLPNCQGCKALKPYLKSAGIQYEDFDISVDNPRDLRSVPALEVDGVVYPTVDSAMAKIRELSKVAK